jgi:hypothetical protein
MISTRETHEILSTAFKTDFFDVGAYVDGSQDTKIISFWCAGIDHFAAHRGILVASVKTNKWEKGLLFIPDITRVAHLDREKMSDKVIIVDISDWDDPVSEGLHDIDILPMHDEKYYFGYLAYSYSLLTGTYNHSARIGVQGGAENPKLRHLWSSLLETIFTFADIYNDEQLNEYLDIHRRYSHHKMIKSKHN